ncbi:wax ester/triacylglycerol synthase domain-containing protein [Frigoribacterium sp. UYMn621]|uniref:wax ester/triacylglycerol synthase domain-containing protein n=1 Tax=Frigoribacterium sp. UYMn621 TaxID=3156343 RepID=UPI003390EB2C
MARVDRVSSDDLMSLATDRGTVPMQVGAALILDTRAGCDPADLIAAIGRRVPAVPRLRQRLVRPGILFGRQVWVDDPRFKIEDHVAVVSRPTAGGMGGLLEIASELLSTRLPSDRPLWTALIVPELDDGRTGLVIVFHHVVADGIAGLAILSALADGNPKTPNPIFPHAAPSRTELAKDAALEALGVIRRLPQEIVRLGQALGQLGPSLRTHASRSSLNKPIKGRQRFTVVTCDLAAIQEVGHANRATVNDVVLSAITGALRHLLLQRGEDMNEFVISIPFSSRRAAGAGSLGNQTGAVPIRLPATGAPLDRLAAVATITRAEKLSTRGASAAILGPLFRALARVGLFQHFVDHQRVVQTFVTNVRGPATALTFGGFLVRDIVPLTVAAGNVTVSFAVLSYAGRLTITIVSDPKTCPDLPVLRAALSRELDAL